MMEAKKATKKNTFGIIVAIAAGVAVLIGIVAAIVFLVGGQAKTRDGSIVEFSFGHGSGMGGDIEYTLKRQDNLALLSINRTGPLFSKGGDVKKTVDGKYLDRLADIINENEVVKWDGFDRSDNGVLDGGGFVLKITYDDGKTIEAHGYMMFPDNYDVVSDKFEELFSEIEKSINY